MNVLTAVFQNSKAKTTMCHCIFYGSNHLQAFCASLTLKVLMSLFIPCLLNTHIVYSMFLTMAAHKFICEMHTTSFIRSMSFSSHFH